MMSAQWSEDQTRMLIDERRDGNEEYHRTPKRNKRNFWERIAEDINRANNTNYFTGEDCNKKFLALTRAYYTALAYKKAKAEAESQERPSTNEESVTGAGDQPPAKAITKKKRSIIGEHYYEEFSTEFWKEPGSQRSTMPSNTTIQSTPGPLETGSDTSSSPQKQTKSSRPVTPSIETPVVSRPVTPTLPSFLQSANTINITINNNFAGPDEQVD